MASRCHAWVCPVRVNDTRARRDSTAKCALGHAPSLLACPQLARSPLRVPGCVMGCPPITPFCTARSLRTSAATSSPTAGGSEVNRGSSIDGWGRSYKTRRLKKWPSFGPLCRLARRTASQHVLIRTVAESCDVLESERAWRRRRGSSSTTGNEQRRMQRDLVTLRPLCYSRYRPENVHDARRGSKHRCRVRAIKAHARSIGHSKVTTAQGQRTILAEWPNREVDLYGTVGLF